jgi:S-adenosylhomocysteine hydrolase
MLEETRSRLKVVNVLARKILKTHGKIFERTSAILLLHALEDLPPFLEAFESLGLSPADSLFYYKRYPYLNKEETLSWLRERGYQAEPMEGLQDTMPAFLAGVGESRRIVVLEDGGYIGPNLHSYENTPWEQIDGAVEQTERGVRMYEAVGNLRIPVAPVARCGLKNRQEPPHIGRTIVSNIQQLLPGRNLAGTRCVVIGYGHIGAAVCNAARAAGMIVSVYDADHGALAKAAQESFDTRDNLRSLLGDSQMVIGTTGNQSLGQDDILSLPHGMVLVSGSSGQYEIGIEALDVLSCKKTALDVGTAYTLEKEDREVILLGDGYPINFVGGNSVPDEAIDPVLGALLVATIAMVHEPPSDPGIQLEWTNDTMSRYELEKLYYNLYFS